MADDIRLTNEQKTNIIEVWKTVVSVQMHFNDISMRIRSMFVTILLALFASIGLLLDKDLSLDVLTFRIEFSTLIPLFGVFGTFLFYFIDRYWYHRLLVGSVKHAVASIEKKYKSEMPELSLSDSIGAESPYMPRGLVKWLAVVLVRHDKFRETGQLHSDGKIELFYKSVMLVLIVTAIILAVLGGVRLGEETSPAPGAPTADTAPVAEPVTALRQVQPSALPVPAVGEAPADQRATPAPSTDGAQ
jgi:hypothetical protein